MTFKNRKTITISAAAVAGILVMAFVLMTNTNITATAQTVKPTVSIPSISDANLQLNMPGGFAPIQLAQAQEDEAHGAHVVHMTLVAIEKTIKLPSSLGAPGQVIAYTFNGTIPGPTIRVTQGDIVNATIINPQSSTDNHSIDNHASIVTAANFLPTTPGTSKSYTFVATQAGAFEYHCEGNVVDLDEHVFRGMQGMVIVDPINGYQGYDLTVPSNSNGPDTLTTEQVSPNAKEVTLDFSEYYLTNTGDYNRQAMFNHNATFTYINGIPFGYDPVITKTTGAIPLHFNVGDHVRFFLLNVGDELLNFHIVGQQLNRVDQGGVIEKGVQTINLGGSNTAIVDVKFDQPGLYVIVNHNYSPLFKGQFAPIIVDSNTATPNPSNAVPPTGSQSISQPTTPYTMGTPLNSNCVQYTSGKWTINTSDTADSCNLQVPSATDPTS